MSSDRWLCIVGELHRWKSVAVLLFGCGPDHDRGTFNIRTAIWEFEHVGNKCGDVVGSTTRQRPIHQCADDAGGIRWTGQEAGDVGIRHHSVQTVAAQEESITCAHREDGQVGIDLVDSVQGSGQQVPSGMNRCLIGGDLPGIDQCLHVSVVVGQLGEHTIA